MTPNEHMQSVLNEVLVSIDKLGRERDAAVNALHGMRRRVERLSDELAYVRRELAVTRDLLESTDNWQQGMLEDHWDAVREQAAEEE